jgi:polysaccharide export outer membrane protein
MQTAHSARPILATSVVCSLAFILAAPPAAIANEKAVAFDASARSSAAFVRSAHRAPIKTIEDTYQLDEQSGGERYRLSPSDVIAITFPQTPALNQVVTVQPDGFVHMARVGDVRVGGLTTDETLASIQSAYALVLQNPAAALELKDFKRPYFIVAGAVRNPGKYDLRGFTPVTEAIATAGGFDGSANHSSVLLFRRSGNDWYQVRQLNFKKLFEGRDITEDVDIRAGDMLVVPTTVLSRIRHFIF